MEKCYCPNCIGLTNHNIIFDKIIKQDSIEDVRWKENYQVIECCGCENIQFRKIYEDETMIRQVYSEDYSDFDYDSYNEQNFYPPYIKQHKVLKNSYEIPDKIRVVYFETLEAIKSGSYILAGVGLRSLIEAITINQDITKGNLQVRIGKLVSKKLITTHEADRLHAIRFLGNDSVHEMEVPHLSKIEIALEIVEHLIKNLYLMNIDVAKHLDSIINTYNDFKNLVIKRIYQLSEGDEMSLIAILGKHFRRIESSYVSNFETKLIDEINSKEMTLLKLGEVKIQKNMKGEDVGIQYYKIVHDKTVSDFEHFEMD